MVAETPPTMRARSQACSGTRLDDAPNHEMAVQTLDSNTFTFERVIDSKLIDIFKSMIPQHALPVLWANIVQEWLSKA
ncbi:hypothetical protein PR003_g422 [Phytophthora rubi]|nr:hypothetical protein PF003_g35684 [Phytophthora fragariae]KAE9026570.1 hypothetical protein PF011_g2480 [Phytophthora fragariae]KAE9360069.1 hypothetical protein PR003_g422 [Phytophthora rubi]